MPSKFAALWQELGRPIPENAVRVRTQAGRQLSYITARVTMNRLDSVLGPENWWTEFFPHGTNGVLCKLSIRLPDGSVVSKCDVGGYAGMADGGDDEKSAASDALKRAGVMFGIARELYGDGNAVSDLVSLSKRIEEKVAAGSNGNGSHPSIEFKAPPPPQDGNDLDRLRQSGMIKTGREVYGSSNQGPPPPRSGDVFGGVKEMLGLGQPATFQEMVTDACMSWQEKLKAECSRRRLPPPKPDTFTPEYVAVSYCNEAITTGSMDRDGVVDQQGNFDVTACLNTMASDYDGDMDSVSRCAMKYLENHYHAVIGNIERDNYQQENNRPPNKIPAASERAPSRPQGNGGYGAPRTGKALFAWVKEMEQKHDVGLLKYLNNWAKLQDFPARMIDWDIEHVEMGYNEGRRKLEAIQPEEIPN